MFLFRSSKKYRPLPSSPPEATDGPGPSTWDSSIVLALIACLLCTGINVGLAVSSNVFKPAAPSLSSITRKDVGSLRRPSQFIRFDEIKRPFPPEPKQLLNYPLLVSQIDESEKGRVFEDDTRRYLSPIGTISPEDRRVLVTNKISTVVQFRAIDYGMEICELHIVLPEFLHLQQNAAALSVFRLNASYPIDVKTLAYSNRPAHVGKLADIFIERGTGVHWRRNFTCEMEELLTFELRCSPGDDQSLCAMEWWQNKDDPAAAMYIIQRATL
ncbi:hypothetical protein B0H14DRAFT_3909505 [Mycena olivaceomarginata]|nr:hypothetical protein B0H14DRAFT_3909505 [Mycena olivaceomarginata]